MKTLLFFFVNFMAICNPSTHHQSAATVSDTAISQKIITGAERLDQYLPLLKGKRVGVLVNQTAVVGNTHLVDTLLGLHVNIVKIFGPEHGFRGNADAGEKVGNAVDKATGIPVVSLYGSHSKATSEELQNVDIMLYDIQDVGTRFYTYINSMQHFLEAAAENNKPVIILDRPNPNGFYVDGPVLDKKFRSGVGLQSIPIVYGMTIGEYARMLIGEHWLSDPSMKPGLTVIKCLDYTHKSHYQLPVKPSPNLPNMTAVYLYPSLCFFEGTNCSVGRGTDKPFQLFGRPDFPADLYSFTPESIPGAKNPPLLNQKCYGYLVAASPEQALKETQGQVRLKWLIKAYSMSPDKPHFFSTFFNKLSGNDALMRQIKEGWNEESIRKSWRPAIEKFKDIRKKYLLYPDFE